MEKSAPKHVGWSSCVYPLEAADVLRAPDYDGAPIPGRLLPPDEVLLYIRPDGPDRLLRGRAAVEAVRAAGGDRAVVRVRVVFKPSVPRFNVLASVVRVLRNRYRYHGTGVYHISAAAVRAMGIERRIRTLERPHARKGEDRVASMVRLTESLRRNGYRDDKPIVIMLCRTGGVSDSIRQGHHRVSACLALGIDRMAMEFCAAGAVPWQRWGRPRRIATAAALIAAAAALAVGVALPSRRAAPSAAPVPGFARLPSVVAVGECPRPPHPEELSSITYLGGDEFLAVSDDGSGIWRARLGVDRATGMVTNCTLHGNVKLHGDNEGIAWNRVRGSVFVTDERSRTIREIDLESGEEISKVELPAEQLRSRNNRGIEALDLSPDGSELWAANEEALTSDGGMSTASHGTVVRLVRFRPGESGRWRADGEWAYLTDSIDGGRARRPRSGVSGLCVLGDGVVLVLERELSRKGVDPSYRSRIYAVRPGGDGRFDRARPLPKKLLFGADTGAANYEGICLGPELDGGARSLIMVSDGGGDDAERIYALRLEGGVR